MCDEGFFGDGNLAKKLDEAYTDFRAFCRARKISCSQPPFTPKLVFWLNIDSGNTTINVCIDRSNKHSEY